MGAVCGPAGAAAFESRIRHNVGARALHQFHVVDEHLAGAQQHHLQTVRRGAGLTIVEDPGICKGDPCGLCGLVAVSPVGGEIGGCLEIAPLQGRAAAIAVAAPASARAVGDFVHHGPDSARAVRVGDRLFQPQTLTGAFVERTGEGMDGQSRATWHHGAGRNGVAHAATKPPAAHIEVQAGDIHDFHERQL